MGKKKKLNEEKKTHYTFRGRASIVEKAKDKALKKEKKNLSEKIEELLNDYSSA